MRPTFSIIAFTVLSGIGYGLLFLVGLTLATAGPMLPMAADPIHGPSIALDPRYGVICALAVGVAFVSIGLLASIAHLGRPARAWRAFSQWRSSWLSREGIAAVLSFAPIGAIAAMMLTHPDARLTLRVLGLTLAACCVLTVFCTARIYSSLPPIRAWHNRYTLPGYLLLGLYGGGLWHFAVFVATLGKSGLFVWSLVYYACTAFAIAPAAALLKRAYWRFLDTQPTLANGTATGLARLGTTRVFEQPHTEENYLTHEMGFVLARKHACTLRALAFWLILVAPIACMPLEWLLGGWAAFLGAGLGTLGLFVERWLFFAEARHAVMAYYGR
ncbi:MAG: DmsC/YnfH family molybdoenzyme membrane anchor subunit [Dokdonella sp.]